VCSFQYPPSFVLTSSLTGSARVTVPTTTSVRYGPVFHSPSPNQPTMFISRSYSEGSRSCEFCPCRDVLFVGSYVLGTQLNLEVPQYEFNEAEGKLVIG